METTIVFWGYNGIMEKKMEATIVFWGCNSSILFGDIMVPNWACGHRPVDVLISPPPNRNGTPKDFVQKVSRLFFLGFRASLEECMAGHTLVILLLFFPRKGSSKRLSRSLRNLRSS